MITQLDLNPVIVYPKGKGVLVVDMLLVTDPSAQPSSAVREAHA